MTDFHSLYQQHAPQVHRFVLFLCGDSALADDITSDTFVRAWTARGKIREAEAESQGYRVGGRRGVHHGISPSCATGRAP